MKVKYYIDDKKVTKKSLTERFGAEWVKKFTDEAWETFKEDPNIQFSQFIGNGCLTVEFE